VKLENVPVTDQDSAITRWMSIAGKALCLGVIAGITFDVSGGLIDPLLGTAIVIGPVCLLASYGARIMLSPRYRTIEVRSDDVLVPPHRLARHRIRAAYVVMRKHDGRESPAVEIRTRRGDLHRIFVADQATAHALVDAMGCGRGGKAVRLELGRSLRRLLHPLLALGALFAGFAVLVFALLIVQLVADTKPSGSHFGLMLCIVSAIIYELLKKGVAPPVVTIGSDGIEVKRGYRTWRIPREQIARVGVDEKEGTLAVLRRGARSIVVHGILLDRPLLTTAAAEIERRLTAETNDQHPRAAAFDRGARDVAQWKVGLRATLDAGYRAAGVTLDDASAVLQSPTASVEQRVGAALALRVAGEPPERIRVAAESVVDPKLRVAIEAIADDEDERLEKTLKALR
jgi:hypothetical protein